jgi:hypothetical protein
MAGNRTKERLNVKRVKQFSGGNTMGLGIPEACEVQGCTKMASKKCGVGSYQFMVCAECHPRLVEASFQFNREVNDLAERMIRNVLRLNDDSFNVKEKAGKAETGNVTHSDRSGGTGGNFEKRG